MYENILVNNHYQNFEYNRIDVVVNQDTVSQCFQSFESYAMKLETCEQPSCDFRPEDSIFLLYHHFFLQSVFI